MSNVLLVEPDYRSKFPPLGLMRLSAYHKKRGDCVSFVRGKNEVARKLPWHRIYVSSLFTWELPRTVDTIRYYLPSVQAPEDVFVGGVGVTLYPEYVRESVPCTIVEGQLNKANMLGSRTPAIATLTPDYSILETVDYPYAPRDAYFTRITQGCIRDCKFCAVPILEKEFGFLRTLSDQLREVDKLFGAKQNLVVMDNNILGIDGIDRILRDIAKAGFERGAKRNGRKRSVDFNQGLDARLIAGYPSLADSLTEVSLDPIRLAFDFVGMKKTYIKAIELLCDRGHIEFTNYMLFNFKDSPQDLYDRIMTNVSLNERLGIRITGFPMRFIPMKDVHRGYVSDKWHWRYLRGVQCVLHATRGLVGTNPDFVRAAFGESLQEFLEILAMPDRYIIYRDHYRNDGAKTWRAQYRRLRDSSKNEFLETLAELRLPRGRKEKISRMKRFRSLLEHYYPNGETPPATPEEEELANQGVSAGYDSGPG